MLNYRKATIADAPVLAKMRFELLREASSNRYEEHEREKWEKDCRDYFERAINEDSFVSWVAVDEGQIVATGGASFFGVPPSVSCPSGKVAYLANMYTYPEYRGQGIGARFVGLVIEEARVRGCRKVILHAAPNAVKLYERLGFVDDSLDMVYYIE